MTQGGFVHFVFLAYNMTERSDPLLGEGTGLPAAGQRGRVQLDAASGAGGAGGRRHLHDRPRRPRQAVALHRDQGGAGHPTLAPAPVGPWAACAPDAGKPSRASASSHRHVSVTYILGLHRVNARD